MISVKLLGVNQYIRYLETLKRTVPLKMQKASQEIMERIRDVAIENVNSDIRWGHSVTEPRIADPGNWEIVDTGGGGHFGGKELICHSPHAFIVEYGGIGGIVVSDRPYPIGASQGGGVIFSNSFRLQEGKHYLQRAVNQVAGAEMEAIAYKHLTDAVRNG